MADDSFKNFILDQLDGMPDVRAKRMFGGHGLYAGEVFFGILMDGRVYFRTNERTRQEYVRRGMPPFIYEKARRTMTISYYEVPPEVLENRACLQQWAEQAIQIGSGHQGAPKKRQRAARSPLPLF